MKVLFMLLLLAFPLYAQETNARLSGTCGLVSGSGFENPVCGAEAGGSLNLGRAVIDVNAHYLFAKKIPGGGHNIGGHASARFQLRKSYFVGPAFSLHRQTTSDYVKSAFAFGGEVGAKKDGRIVSARFLQDVTSENKARSYEGRFEWYGTSKKRVGPYVAGRIGMADFKCFQTRHCFSGNVYGTVGFWFR